MKKFIVATALSMLLCLIGAAQANTVTGKLWHVPEAVTLNAVPANVPGTTPDVLFDVLSPMNFFGSGVSVSTWLGNGSAFNIVENTAGTLASLMDNGTVGTLVEFTGFVSVTNGQSVTATHDDGLTLIIGGVNLGFNPGPTAPVASTVTYTGPTGNLPFQLVYAECCGGPAVLAIDLPLSNTPVVPLPSSALLGMGLMGAIAIVKFRRRK